MWRGNVGKQKNGELVTRHTPYSDRNNTQHTFNSEEDRGRNHNCTTGTERGGLQGYLGYGYVTGCSLRNVPNYTRHISEHYIGLIDNEKAA